MSEDLQTEVVRKTLGDRAALYRMLAQLYFKPLTQEQVTYNLLRTLTAAQSRYPKTWRLPLV